MLSALLLSLVLAAEPTEPLPLVFKGVQPALQAQLRAHWRFLGNDQAALEAAMKRVYFGTGQYLASVHMERREGALHVTVKNGGAARIRRVSFVGNKVLDDPSLMARLINREDAFSARAAGLGRYIPQARSEDRTGLRSAYHDAGYIFVEITGPRVSVDPDLSGVRLEFHIREGQRFLVGDLSLNGLPDGFQFPYRSGEPFAVGRIRNAVQATLDAFRRQGYALAKVHEKSQVDQAKLTVALSLAFEPGPLCTIAGIEVEGLQRVDPDRIRQLLRVQPGQAYDHALLKEEIARLRGLGLIMDGAVEAKAGSKPGEVIAVLHLADAMQRWFPAFSMTYLPGEGSVLLLQISSPNLAGRALRFNSSLWLSGERQLFDLSLSQPGFFTPLDSAGGEIHNRDRQRPLIRTRSQGFSVNYGLSLDKRRRWRLGGRLLMDRLETSARELSDDFAQARTLLQDQVFDAFPSGGVSWRPKISLNLSFDNRDSGLLATRGTSVSLGLGYAPSGPPDLAGAVDVSAQWRGYLRLPAKFRFRSLVGGLWQLAQDLHPADRLVVGGMGSLRGYLSSRIGPVLQNDYRLVIGGDRIAKGSLELGRPLNSVLEPFVFLDGANAFSREAGWFVDDAGVRPLVGGLAFSTGFGVLVRLPVLPLRFEWGWPLTRGSQDPEWLFSLGIGTGV